MQAALLKWQNVSAVIPYYVKISTAHPINNGQSPWKFTYLTEAYSATGTAKSLEFIASHVLRPGAYFQVYVRNNSVITWEDIPLHAIPPDARKQLRESPSQR
ncbi:TPA_asm: YxeA family protein [Salmonella enterica subsp. enterica serovar Typhimurium str. SL1344]|uniref:YxeA family protein n=1 Tax=Salmonella typhimurium (strain SL1344) TaxID=216597 RepID=A0A718Y4W7_SALTS|nr:YxeA family protein [Salmonella enterica subsp. enterica serovar Typhimurium str. SL1344]